MDDYDEGSWSSEDDYPRQAIVLYDFIAEHSVELSINKGCTVAVTEIFNDGWLEGGLSATGDLGLFPASYVRFLDDNEDDSEDGPPLDVIAHDRRMSILNSPDAMDSGFPKAAAPAAQTTCAILKSGVRVPDEVVAFAEQEGQCVKSDFYCMGWAQKLKGKKSEARFVVVTPYTLMCITEKGKTKKAYTAGTKHSVVDAVALSWQPGGPVVFEFPGRKAPLEIDAGGDENAVLANAFLQAYYLLKMGAPDDDLMAIDLPKKRADISLVRPAEEAGGRLADLYCALCTSAPKKHAKAAEAYLRAAHAIPGKERTLDLAEMLTCTSKSMAISLDVVVAALAHNMWFTRLCLDATAGTDVDDSKGAVDPHVVEYVADAMRTNSTLAYLEILHPKAKDGFARLGDALAKNNTNVLKMVCLANCPMKDDGGVGLAKGLHNCTWLTSLDLSDTGISHKTVKALFASPPAGAFARLNALNLSGNKLGKHGAKTLAAWLQGAGSKLVTLLLGGTDVDLEVLVEGLGACSSLRSLDISGNTIPEPFAMAFSRMLGTNAVVDLDISHVKAKAAAYTWLVPAFVDGSRTHAILNLSGATSLPAFAPLIPKAPHLVALLLDNAKLGDDGLSDVVAALASSAPPLARLSLSGLVKGGKKKDSPPAVVGEVAALVKGLPALRAFAMRGVDKYVLGPNMQPLLEALASTSITELDVSHQRVGDEGLAVVSAIVRSTATPGPALAYLACDGSECSVAGLEGLASAVRASKVLSAFPLPLADAKHAQSKVKKNSDEYGKVRECIANMRHAVELNRQSRLLATGAPPGVCPSPACVKEPGSRHVTHHRMTILPAVTGKLDPFSAVSYDVVDVGINFDLEVELV